MDFDYEKEKNDFIKELNNGEYDIEIFPNEGKNVEELKSEFLEDSFMETAAIIHELDNLPAYKRMIIVEQIIRSIRLNNQDRTLEIAADLLYDDYKNDKELTIFTQLDCEDFYEPR